MRSKRRKELAFPLNFPRIVDTRRGGTYNAKWRKRREIIYIIEVILIMAENRKRRFGDRKDGRLLRSLDPLYRVSSYIMVNRNGASNFFVDNVDIDEIERYIRHKRRDEGLAGFGIMHVLVAAYVRALSQRPAVNRFISGQKIYAAILGVDREARRISLTHRELLGTWAENAAGFRAGQAVTGIVRSVQPYGAFIELTPNLSGLAEPEDGLEPGQLVSVYIRSILPEKQKIKLTVLEQLDPRNVPPQLLRYYRTVGRLDRWEYAPGSGTVTVF